jgi:hypothetical protein
VNDRADFCTRVAGRHLRPLWEVLDDLVPPRPRPLARAALRVCSPSVFIRSSPRRCALIIRVTTAYTRSVSCTSSAGVPLLRLAALLGNFAPSISNICRPISPCRSQMSGTCVKIVRTGRQGRQALEPLPSGPLPASGLDRRSKRRRATFRFPQSGGAGIAAW